MYLYLQTLLVQIQSNVVNWKAFSSDGKRLLKLNKITAQDFGRIDGAIVIKNGTSLMHGKGDPSVLEQRVSSLKDKITNTNSRYEKEPTNLVQQRGIVLPYAYDTQNCG